MRKTTLLCKTAINQYTLKRDIEMKNKKEASEWQP